MGLIGSLFNTAIDVAVLPLRVAVDVVESPVKLLNGEMPGSKTAEGLADIAKDIVD